SRGRSDWIVFVGAVRTTTARGKVSRFCWCSRFWSAVTNASKLPPARRSSSPFGMPVQPIAATVRTSCSGSNLASRRGSDSSRRTRTGGQQISGEFESGDRLFTAHTGKVVEKFVEGVPAREVVDQVLHGDAGPTKDGRAPKNLWIAVNDGVHRRHVAHRTPWTIGSVRIFR